MRVRGRVDVLELRVSVWVRGAFLPVCAAIAAGSPSGAAAGSGRDRFGRAVPIASTSFFLAARSGRHA